MRPSTRPQQRKLHKAKPTRLVERGYVTWIREMETMLKELEILKQFGR